MYIFDMFLAPEERKGGLAAALQSNAMHALGLQGYERAYGYYWVDNLPALWISRVMNRWRDINTLSLNRLLLFKW